MTSPAQDHQQSSKVKTWPYTDFNPDLITVDWVHGPRRRSQRVHLRYKPSMRKFSAGPRKQFEGVPVRFCLPSRLQQTCMQERFMLNGKPHARLRFNAHEMNTFVKLILNGIYERVQHILNGQFAVYSKNLRLQWRAPVQADGTWVVAVADEGCSATAVQLSYAWAIHGHTLFLPFTLV